MDFFVDEFSIAEEFSKGSPDLPAVRELAAAMEQVVACDECILIVAPNFYELEYGDGNIAALLFNEHYASRRDDLLRLQLVVDSALEEGERSVNNGIDMLQQASRGGLCSLRDRTTEGWWKPESMWWLSRQRDVPLAVRGLFGVFALAEERLEALTGTMFPNIHFHVLPTCKKLGIDQITGVRRIIKHLAWLNDSAADLFATRLAEVIGLAGSAGVEISPESPNTHADAAAMKERQITIAGKTIVCEWHAKFEKTYGRLHFYAFPDRPQEVRDLVGEKVIVGIAAVHLK